MKDITIYNVSDEVNTVEKTIAWLQKKFRNDEKFSIRIDEHIPFQNIDLLPTSELPKKVCTGNPKYCEGCASFAESEAKHTMYHKERCDSCDYKCEYVEVCSYDTTNDNRHTN